MKPLMGINVKLIKIKYSDNQIMLLNAMMPILKNQLITINKKCWLLFRTKRLESQQSREVCDMDQLARDLSILLTRHDMSDIVLVVGREQVQFFLHSLILACRFVLFG